MIINKQIVLDLLFEAYRTTLATIELEKYLKDDVLFVSGTCVHGSDVFSIVLEILGIEAEEQEEYEVYYLPFLSIINHPFENSQQTQNKIEEYYHWIVSME